MPTPKVQIRELLVTFYEVKDTIISLL